jgi:hypothetical protein
MAVQSPYLHETEGECTGNPINLFRVNTVSVGKVLEISTNKDLASYY